MKRILSLLLALCLLIALGACAAQPAESPEPSADAEDSRSAADIWAAVQEQLPADSLPAFMELDAAGLESYYGLTEAQVESFVCQFPMMNVSASEILIAKCVPGQEETVKAGAEKRQADLVETWANYLPAQLELVENYHLVQEGQWLLFVVAEQADTVESAFLEAVRAA